MDESQKLKFIKTNFWKKIKETGKKIPFLKDVIAMYYCLLDENTSLSAKTSIVLALLYFISPVDAIPDVILALGFTDDAGVIATTLLIIKSQLKPEHYAKANESLSGET
ncbi:YkvA family protein [Leptospira vanthielii]|uniref:PF06803 family protein n=1 Tax=Leptospira vanthielii serovar Holland str. Waz Holland = ATCC 700522 TaxID=1218591 RepID=N1WAB0_9LEPT|nr:YkvA family protein [Leptospira vanthielii]EMY71933.1 PF06803 family protein [Leptospira vanthielii serovar Holland str. Waz Holland = ATCC 700522]